MKLKAVGKFNTRDWDGLLYFVLPMPMLCICLFVFKAKFFRILTFTGDGHLCSFIQARLLSWELCCLLLLKDLSSGHKNAKQWFTLFFLLFALEFNQHIRLIFSCLLVAVSVSFLVWVSFGSGSHYSFSQETHCQSKQTTSWKENNVCGVFRIPCFTD